MRDRPGLRGVVFDCRDAFALAHWWAEALGWTVHPLDDEDLVWLAEHGFTPETDPAVGVDPPDPSLPMLWFNRVPEAKVVKNRVHLDVNVADAAGIDRLVALGARAACTSRRRGLDHHGRPRGKRVLRVPPRRGGELTASRQVRHRQPVNRLAARAARCSSLRVTSSHQQDGAPAPHQNSRPQEGQVASVQPSPGRPIASDVLTASRD
jgi:hypothetical protein